MNDETTDRVSHLNELFGRNDAVMTEGRARSESTSENVPSIAISATFTADLISAPLQFWMDRLAIPARVTMAPYAQLIQELLNPTSVLSSNGAGFNVLLIRLQDWIRDRVGTPQSNLEHLQRVAGDLIEGMDVVRTRTKAPILVLFCPSSASLPEVYREPIESLQRDLACKFESLAYVHCWDHVELARLYPVVEYEDSRMERLGHIPFSRQYFVAMATLLARRIAALVKPQYKVIALDCDNTLWRGICGEDGVAGIELTPAHLEFQRMLVRQHDAGVLLCLCSKNNERDVAAVFEQRSDMILRQEHVIASRVNWNPKSQNLQSLAQELDLGLDSFIFVDDSAMECAEVRDNCAPVLTLQFPTTPAEIEHFGRHVWAFDRIGVTEDAKRRTEQYRQNRAREVARKDAGSLAKFLASLELVVDVSPLQPAQLARAAELVQRTNQFNLTGIRRRAGEIESLWSAGELDIRVVHVRDRFGDYGLVGALFLRYRADAIEVDTFVLSCRVLGRGVEHRIVNELGKLARARTLPAVVLRYRKTSRNAPAWEFIEKHFLRFEQSNATPEQDRMFAISVGHAEATSVDASGQTSDLQQEQASTKNAQPLQPASTQWHQAAFGLSRIVDIVEEMNRSSRSQSQSERDDYVAPRTPVEEAVAQIWAEVLGRDKVSVDSDFLDLGGNSLLAVQAIAHIESVLGLELSVFDFFEDPTVAGIAEKLADAAQAEAPIQPVDRSVPLPLSSAQRRLWFIDQIEGGSLAYHVPLAVKLVGSVDRDALQKALDALVARHEVLRTRFSSVGGEPVQHVVADVRFQLLHGDLTELSDAVREQSMSEVSRQELTTPFDLKVGALIRGRLVRLSREEHVLLITMHHIVADGWSIGVLFQELGVLYGSFRSQRSAALPPLPVQYADYAQWQRNWLAGAQLQTQLAYWREHLQGAPQVLELPADRPRPSVQSYRGANVAVCIEPALTAELKRLSRSLNLTLAMTLQAAWAIVIARLSGTHDVVLGMPVANRRRAEIEGLIGFFVNTLAVRLPVDDDSTASDLLLRTKETLLGAYAHQDVPFELVVEALQPARSMSHSPIFQNMFVFQNAPRRATQLEGLSLSEQEVPLQTAQFDTTLTLQETGDRIVGMLNYASDLFDESTISRWLRCFQTLLQGLVLDPQLPVSRLPLLTASEQQQIIDRCRAVQTFPQHQLIHESFEAQAGRTPHALAVTCEGESLSYAELNRKANQLANYLREKGVGPNQPVGICVERGLAMVIGLLGILKAGGGYVPLDPNYPADRLQYILDDAAPSVVLIEEKLRPTLPPTRATVVALDSAWAEIGQRPDSVAVNPAGSHPEQLAYVIYTSGSTGKPKGVMVEHRNVTRLFAATAHWFKFNERDVWTLFHSFAFDFSVWELWGALFYGGRVVVVPYRTARSPQDFYQLVCDERVTVLNQTPSAFAQLIDARARAPQKHSLRVVIFGGEALELRMLRPWIELEGAEQTQLVNMYGITETTVHVTYRPPLTREQIEREHGSGIGQPIPDLSAYLLDRHQQLLPIGVVGEMYIGGGGVARGYLNRAELTDERFIRDPFSADPRARLYKTGDLGRWRADGTLEYLGRNDLQVKIRGFRIELGEIEAQLARHAEVKEAVVLARADVPGDKRLVAYVIAADATAPKADALRAHLRNLLPEYMVPSAFVMLETFPLTSNGKLDRRALPAPERDAYASREYAAPVGDTEQLLAQIWKDLLHVEQVGRNDNFFELGGHSLLIMQMMERVRGHGLTTEVRRVFESPTLADLARALTRATTSAVEAPPNLIPPNCAVLTPEMLPLIDLNLEHVERIVAAVPGGASNIQDVYPLAPLQEGILFHHLMSEHGDTYVVPTLLAAASRREVDELIAALQGVIDRHDVLRTAVLWEELPQPVQVVHRKARLPVEEVVLDGARDVKEQVTSWLDGPTQTMDLRLAPLLRLRIAADPNCGQWFVLLTQHHIVSDNTSQAIVFSEIAAHLDGRSDVLPAPLPYRNHVAQALAYARTHDADAFFRKRLGDVDEPTVPFGLLDVRGDHLDVLEAQEPLSSELAQRLRAQARRLGVSAATLFHAAWAVVVANTSGKDDVVFGSVLLGRMHSNNGAQQILGMFINTLPLRLNLRAATATELVEQTQRELVDLLSHEQASLADAQRCSAIDGATPLFTALLNFRHGVGAGAASLSSRPGIQVLAERTGTNYPITVSVDDLGEGFSITAQTHRHVDPQRVAAYLRTAVESLLDALEHSLNVRALTLPILPALERQQVIEQFNATDMSYPRGSLVHQLFERQALRTPTAVAVLHDERSITYAELNEEANKLARYLLALGAGPEELVGICAERSIEMVIGLLGILKAGAAYLPLDPNYPAERLHYMLDDGAPRVVLTQQSLSALLGHHQAAISLEEVFKDMGSLSARNIAASELAQDPRNTVYVIYTSGSTGRPKGTAMPHAAMVNLIEWHRHTFGSAAGQRVLQFAALSFDVAFQEIFSTLSTGGTLVLLDEWMRRDPRALTELLASQEIARLFVPPLMLHSIAETVATESAHVDLSRLRDVITAGEQLRISPEISAMFGRLQGCRLHNHYGPTETHVVTALTLQGEPQAWPVLPSIGRPIANTHIYVLNRQGLPTPIGVAGEVYIAGEGVARGYLRCPGLTAERFISAAFGAASRCMYKTGDLGRWLPDGTLEHLGRNDDQVKIRGFRVELGEIEARLALHEGVKETAVIAREDVPGEKRLVAYVTSAEATPPTVESLREHMQAALPEHMVPSAFVVLESMPLTPSGKLSRRSLPQPELGAYASKEYEPPRGEVEQALAEIFQELLRADRVGRNDSFFELGGHSILAMQVTARIRSNLRVEMPIKTIFDRPTIAELAEYVAERQVDTHELLARVASMADEDARALLHGLRMEA